MNHETTDRSSELRRIVRMLEKTASMAEHASLTGSMAGGHEVAVRSYNSTVEHLASIGEIPAGLFPPLPADANLDSAGIAAAQLAEYLRAGLPEPEQELGGGKGPALVGGDSVIINLGGLGDIAELVREHLPEWLRGKRREPEAEPGSAERPEAGHAGGAAGSSAPRSAGEPTIHQLTLPPQQTRIEELRPERQQTPR